MPKSGARINPLYETLISLLQQDELIQSWFTRHLQILG